MAQPQPSRISGLPVTPEVAAIFSFYGTVTSIVAESNGKIIVAFEGMAVPVTF